MPFIFTRVDIDIVGKQISSAFIIFFRRRRIPFGSAGIGYIERFCFKVSPRLIFFFYASSDYYNLLNAKSDYYIFLI